MTHLCKEAVFHFNKQSLVDTTLPPWIVKAKGQTFYVRHVTASATWSTKETPNNSHTKGALKFKNVKIEINEQNEAIIAQQTEVS